jgi:hypothetical protein
LGQEHCINTISPLPPYLLFSNYGYYVYLGSLYGSKSKSVKLKLKGGGFVDPETCLVDKASVLQVEGNMYSIVLGNVNIQDGRNSYYKMQVLKHDKKDK